METRSSRRRRSDCSRKPPYLTHSYYVERRLLQGLRRSAPYSRTGLPPRRDIRRVQDGRASVLHNPLTRDRDRNVQCVARSPVGQGMVHGRAGEAGRRLASRCVVRDGHARPEGQLAGQVDVRALWGEPDGEECARDGRDAEGWQPGSGAALASLAGGQHPPRIAARGRAESRGAARRDHGIAGGGRGGRDRGRRHERDHAVRRDAHSTKRVVGCVGGGSTEAGPRLARGIGGRG